MNQKHKTRTSLIERGEADGEFFTIALAGNANVGKSAIFNQLTGLMQETGNWSGKTVALKEGFLVHHNIKVKIIDLPGIYSFNTYSSEEQITRQYILENHPDVVINVLDSTSLERNLYFSLQLKEMDVPLVFALNYSDIARKKHINIDTYKLSQILEAPVINTIAITGVGVHELVDAALAVKRNVRKITSERFSSYGIEIESRISRLNDGISGLKFPYPTRWVAIKMLEGDTVMLEMVNLHAPALSELSHRLADEISNIHGEDSAAVIASERYALAARITGQISSNQIPSKGITNTFDSISLHPVIGYILLFTTIAAILVFISFFGGWMTEVITSLFERFNPQATGKLADILWNGGAVGFYAALSVAAGFILPFYIILGILGDSGYLPRIAFLMDRPCHMIGLHGQASLPLIAAFGCNVPACLGCRIMDNKRDRMIATFLSTMVPCSARTSVVLGLVGAFVGWQWAVGLLIFQFILIFIIGQIINRLKPSTSPGIILEIPEYRVPSWKIVWRQAWYKFKDFLIVGIPLIVAGSVVIEALRVFEVLDTITRVLNPVTVSWLGLPAFAGMLLIFGILRKEANLALLISFAGGASVATIMTTLQMVVFSLVILLYIPCVSTIAVLVKETGVKLTAAMVIGEIVLAILVGGIANRVLGLFM